jgi:hypothetical protein
MFFRLEGEIDEDIIENIENAKNYLNDFKEIQEIIKDNTGKKTRYGTPEDCITGILENSEQLQAIIKTLCFRKTRPLTLCTRKSRLLTLCTQKIRPLTLCKQKIRPLTPCTRKYRPLTPCTRKGCTMSRGGF